MNYILIPYLEEMTLVKIATRLWNRDDVRILTANFNLDEAFNLDEEEKLNRWKEIEDRVIEKRSQLILGIPLKKKLSHFIKLIGMEILKWIEYHGQRNYLSVSLPNNLHWTLQGTVDNKKIAELLIKDEGLDITSRYKLACIYCFENDIQELWNKIPENERQYYRSEERTEDIKENQLVVFWTYDINGERARMEKFMISNWRHFSSPYQYIFEYAASGTNKVATEFFLQKLTPEEREKSLLRSTRTIRRKKNFMFDIKFRGLPQEYHTEVLYFLLSQMSEEQLKRCGDRNYEVLNHFFTWPWQSYFMVTAKRLLAYLSEEYCNDLLRNMADKVLASFKEYDIEEMVKIIFENKPTNDKTVFRNDDRMSDSKKEYDYEQLFKRFWEKLLPNHKTYVRNDFYNSYYRESLFSKLRRIDNEALVNLILSYPDILRGERR